MGKKRLFAYYRLSRTPREKDVINNQRVAVRKWIDVHPNYEIVEEFEDIYISGYETDRPEFLRMLSQINEVDGLILYDVSRFGRHVMNTVPKFMDLLSRGKCIILVKNNIVLDYKEGEGASIWDMLIPVIEMFQAEEYLTNMKKRQRLGIERYREQHGGRWGRPKSWGKYNNRTLSKKEFIKIFINLTNYGAPKTVIARMLSMDIHTLYRRLYDLIGEGHNLPGCESLIGKIKNENISTG